MELQKEFDDACINNYELSVEEIYKIQQDIDLIKDLFYDKNWNLLY